LEAKDPVPALRVMHATGIAAEILPADLHLARLERLIAIQGANGLAPDALLRLAALIPGGAAAACKIAGALKLSNAARDRLATAAEKDERIGASLDGARARKLLYSLHTDAYRDSLLLQWADSTAAAGDAAWRAQLALATDWKRPVFPLDGNDAMALGYDEGPQIGVAMREIETWWMENDFTADRPALLQKLKEAATKPRG
jgi:poly(A) polymerase